MHLKLLIMLACLYLFGLQYPPSFYDKNLPLLAAITYHEIENKTLLNFTALNRDFKQTRQLLTEQKTKFYECSHFCFGRYNNGAMSIQMTLKKKS